MSSFSYHELSHQDPSMKSKKNERGLNIILGVWTAVGVFFLYQGGLLENPTPRIGEFPGGEFVFKSDSRDYAASGGACRALEDLLKSTSEECIDPISNEPSKYWDHTIYIFYHDDPKKLPWKMMPRYSVGALLRPKQKHLKEKIVAIDDTYESVTVPKGKAAIIQFPHTDGLTSLLLFPYKVLSPLLKFANENRKGEDRDYGAIITTCDKEKSICTHYAVSFLSFFTYSDIFSC
uniref:Uncharacterized protein n=1 Tax=Corethron hystrix TaxID=216773 RepID=A0A7S1BMS7_9STRA|mmetsp:Transcript_34286/g.79252  ORF Transcript_34286/g.79252 Transcript_34286/m.79252 type:complete len:234 (+) Transcript_34286:52-753(+)